MGVRRVGTESFDREIVDTDKPNVSVNQPLRAVGRDCDKLPREAGLPVGPQLGVARAAQKPGSTPRQLQGIQLVRTNLIDLRQVRDHGRPDHAVQRQGVRAGAVREVMKRGVDVCACVDAAGHVGGVDRVTTLDVKKPLKAERGIARPRRDALV